MNFFRPVRRIAAPFIFVALSISISADEQRQRASEAESTGSATEGRLNLNTATLKELESVPVIGADGARTIIAARPFKTMKELDLIKGISAERLEQIRAQVTVATPYVPRTAETPVVPDTSQQSWTNDDKKKIDINTADLKTLESIPSIGAETARAIVAARPFTTIDDLSRLDGLSAERLEQIRAQVFVAPANRAKEKVTPPAAKPADRR